MIVICVPVGNLHPMDFENRAIAIEIICFCGKRLKVDTIVKYTPGTQRTEDSIYLTHLLALKQSILVYNCWCICIKQVLLGL